MDTKRAKISDVAKLASVSPATVSNVFSGRKAVNDALKKQVLKAADELNYHPDKAASLLRSGENRIIAVLMPDITDTFFSMIVSNLEVMAFEDGYDVIVASSHNDVKMEKARIDALLAWRPAGFICVPCSGKPPKKLLSMKNDMPVILVDRIDSNLSNIDTVTIDNYEAGEIAAKHLIEYGHNNIVLAASDLSHPPIKLRAQGAINACESDQTCRIQTIEVGSDIEKGTNILHRWLDKNTMPSAVIALTNFATLSFLAVAANKKILIPKDISLVAFDDYTWMAARNTGLTAIRQPVDEISQSTWKLLKERIINKKLEKAQSKILHASLVIRSSVSNFNLNKKQIKLSYKNSLT